jgi:outer membrane lipoprotein SlyB
MSTRYLRKSPLLSLSLASVLAVGALTGCSTTDPYATTAAYPATAYPSAAYPSGYPAGSTVAAGYGRIESIEYVRGGATGSTSGAGAVVGGLVGGLLGNQVGGGTGRTAATVAGAVGGAVVGNSLERNRQVGDVYQIGVRLDNGAYVTVMQDSVADLRIGNRVTIQNNRVYRY